MSPEGPSGRGGATGGAAGAAAPPGVEQVRWGKHIVLPGMKFGRPSWPKRPFNRQKLEASTKVDIWCSTPRRQEVPAAS